MIAGDRCAWASKQELQQAERRFSVSVNVVGSTMLIAAIRALSSPPVALPSIQCCSDAVTSRVVTSLPS